MDGVIVGFMAVLTLLVVALILIVVLKSRSRDSSSEIQASLQKEFLAFQTSIHQELNSTRTSVDGAKDVISGQAVSTSKQIGEIGETVQKLIHQQEEAQRLGQSLKDLLQAPKLRGNYGEAILEEIIERVLPKGIWERQYAIDGSAVVDCAVKFKDVVIPIDAKFPRDDYLRYMEARSPEAKESAWKEFEKAIKRQMVSIQDKYIRPESGTSEFALMFIPSEAIYYETIAETNDIGNPSSLLEYAQERHVMPVSPNTFYAFLQMVMLGVRNAEVVKNARRVQEGLAKLDRSFDLFYKKYDEIGKRIEAVSEAYRIGDGHIGRYKRSVEETLQLEALQPSPITEPPEGLGQTAILDDSR
jgi:DNA recombination protein RmuC